MENNHISFAVIQIKRRAEQALHAEVENDNITKRRAEQAFHEEVENDHISFAVIQQKESRASVPREGGEQSHQLYGDPDQKESRASAPRAGGEHSR